MQIIARLLSTKRPVPRCTADGILPVLFPDGRMGTGRQEDVAMEDRISEIIERSGNEINMLRLLDAGERKRLARCFELVRYPPGAVCFREGEKISTIGLIAAGKMKFERQARITGKPILLAILGKGSHVGDFSMQPEREAFGQLTAVEDTELLVTTHARLDAFMQEHPATGVKILKAISTILSIRLKNAIDRVVWLS
jgi:CRP-like cAMP-binding protein